MTKILFVTRRDLLAIKGGDTLRALYLLELFGNAENVSQIDILYVGKSRSVIEFREFSFYKKIGNLFNVKQPTFNLLYFLKIVFYWIFHKSSFTFSLFKNKDIDDFINDSITDYCKIVYHLGRGVDLSQVREVDVIDLTDAISLNYAGITITPYEFIKSPITSLKKILLKIDSSRVRDIELQIIRSSATVSFVSDRDRNYLLSFSDNNIDKTRILVLPNKRKFLPAQVSTLDRPQNLAEVNFLFIGNLRSLQNQDGVFYFLDRILPLIQKTMQRKFKLILAGTIPEHLEKILFEREDVEVFGEFKDLAELCKLNVIGVAPINIGAGLQNKVVDYIDMSIDFVATSISVGGLSDIDQMNLNIADTPEMFCKSLCTLISNPTLFEDLALRKRICEERFGGSEFDTYPEVS